MKSLSLAAVIAAIPFFLMPADATAQMHGGHGFGGGHFGGGGHSGGGGHFSGGGHFGGGHFAGQPRGFGHPGFAHGGRFAHGFHGGHFGSFVVIGGVWYPWYAYPYPAPVYANAWYYYCQSAGAYYPYVTYCPEPWVLVAP